MNFLLFLDTCEVSLDENVKIFKIVQKRKNWYQNDPHNISSKFCFGGQQKFSLSTWQNTVIPKLK